MLGQFKYRAFGLAASVAAMGWSNLSASQWGQLDADGWGALPATPLSNMGAGGQKSYYLDPETQLYLLGGGTNGRCYDADTGRFLSEDPVRQASGDDNLFRYVGNNPINKVDPSGKGPWSPSPTKEQQAAQYIEKYPVNRLDPSGADAPSEPAKIYVKDPAITIALHDLEQEIEAVRRGGVMSFHQRQQFKRRADTLGDSMAAYARTVVKNGKVVQQEYDEDDYFDVVNLSSSLDEAKEVEVNATADQLKTAALVKDKTGGVVTAVPNESYDVLTGSHHYDFTVHLASSGDRSSDKSFTDRLNAGARDINAWDDALALEVLTRLRQSLEQAGVKEIDPDLLIRDPKVRTAWEIYSNYEFVKWGSGITNDVREWMTQIRAQTGKERGDLNVLRPEDISTLINWHQKVIGHNRTAAELKHQRELQTNVTTMFSFMAMTMNPAEAGAAVPAGPKGLRRPALIEDLVPPAETPAAKLKSAADPVVNKLESEARPDKIAPQAAKGAGGVISETRGAVTNLGTRTAAENSELFAKLKPGEGMSGVYDHSSGNFILRPSEDVRVGPLREGWVRQYGGHGDVRVDLGQALGEDLSAAAKGRLSGFSISKEADGTIRFGWRSRTINDISHGDIAVPEALRPAIEAAVRKALGL